MTDPPDDQSNDVQRWVDRLIAAARSGEVEDVGTGQPLDPAAANDRIPERTIPAAALREVLRRSDLVVDPHGLRINGARITGALDLEQIQFAHPLHLTSSRIDEDINLNGSALKELTLNGSHI